MNYDLPTSLEVGGRSYEIRSDFRAILDICEAMADPDLSNDEKFWVFLTILYPDLDDIPAEDMEEALKKACWFLDCGQEEEKQKKPKPKLMDWGQDFSYVIGPINHVAGKEIRSLEYLHWWTFISYYMEVDGDSTFGTIVRIRDKLARGEKLEKYERKWYEQNRSAVDFKNKYSTAEKDIMSEWMGKKNG